MAVPRFCVILIFDLQSVAHWYTGAQLRDCLMYAQNNWRLVILNPNPKTPRQPAEGILCKAGAVCIGRLLGHFGAEKQSQPPLPSPETKHNDNPIN